MEKIIYANGTADVLVPAGHKIAVATYGNEYATLSFNRGNNRELIQRLDNAQVTLGPWTDARTVSIEAAQDQVSYDVATNPSIDSNVRISSNPLTGGRALTAGGSTINVSGDYPKLSAIDGVVAFWDFTESRAPYVSKVGAPYQLVNGAGSKVRKSTGGPLGHSVVFNGTTDFLRVPSDQIGELNAGVKTGKVFVLAFLKRADSSSTGCVAGIWQEDDGDPRRQYALFVDLPVYGGDNKVCFHVSKTGGASPRIPYSRDYSSNGSAEPNRDWACISGSYDGAYARSYIEGRFESYANYTEPGAPNGEGLTYDKNPYAFSDGLNTVAADFTVGACKLTGGMGNFYAGEISALLVMDRAPSLYEVAEIQECINTSGWGIKNRFAQWDQNVTGVAALTGCNAYRGATATPESSSGSGVFLRTSTGTPAQMFVYRANTSGAGVAAFTCESIADGFTSDNLLSASFRLANANTGDTVRFMVRVGSGWYATAATYAVSVVSASGGDWSLAETKTITFEKTASLWRDVELTPGSSLVLAGAVRSTDLPSGPITAYGIYSPSVPAGNVRFRDFELIKV